MSAIEIAIPKEIREYEAKLVGNFTTRKLVCSVIAVACSSGVYFLQKKGMGIENPSGFLSFIAALPGAAFIFKPYGLKMETFLKAAFIDNVIAPKNRIYKVENVIENELGFLDEDDEVQLQEVTEVDSNGNKTSKKEIKKIKKENAKIIKKYQNDKKAANKPIPVKKLPNNLKPYK